MPCGTNAPKLWPAEPLNLSWIVSSGRPVDAVLLGDLAAEHRADGAVDVADRQLGRHLLAALDAPAGTARAAVVMSSDFVEAVILLLICSSGRRPGRRPAGSRICEKSSPFAFQCSIAVARARAGRRGRPSRRACGSRARAMSSRTSSAMKREEVDDVLGLAGELLAQLRILRGDADRAGVEMADAHHDAAERDQRRGGEAELLGAEQRGDRRRRGRSSAGRRSARRCGRAGRSAPASAASRRGRAPTAGRRA